jgi:hypothetical protein
MKKNLIQAIFIMILVFSVCLGLICLFNSNKIDVDPIASSLFLGLIVLGSCIVISRTTD